MDDTVGRLQARVKELEADLLEYTQLFDRMWEADRRGTERWRVGHPERNLSWPDRANLVEWLMDMIDDKNRRDADLREYIIGQIHSYENAEYASVQHKIDCMAIVRDMSGVVLAALQPDPPVEGRGPM